MVLGTKAVADSEVLADVIKKRAGNSWMFSTPSRRSASTAGTVFSPVSVWTSSDSRRSMRENFVYSVV
jgi:3-hydroxyisobutyrate dehydrogenase-like beta-hydroxyacid dehydrogenase